MTKKKPVVTSKKISKAALKRLHKKAWRIFSEYIRRRDKGICFTCGDKRPWKQQNAGHFRHDVLDFDELNIHCQCRRCNHFYSGKLDIYGRRLIELHGLETLMDLHKRADEFKPYSQEELERIIYKYGLLLKGVTGDLR